MIDTIEVNPQSIIVMKFDLDKVSIEEAEETFKTIKEAFPNNMAIGIPEGCSLYSDDKETVIENLKTLLTNLMSTY